MIENRKSGDGLNGDLDLLFSEVGSAGSLAVTVAHDVNNILAAIMVVASAMSMEMPTDSSCIRDAQDIEDILKACKRGSKITSDLLAFARRHKMSESSILINQCAVEVQEVLSRILPQQISIVIESVDNLKSTIADSDQISHALINICISVASGMKGQGVLRLKSFNITMDKENCSNRSDAKMGEYVCCGITDTNEAISLRTMPNTKDSSCEESPVNMTFGVGSKLIYNIIKKYGGFIDVHNGLNNGSMILICLPAT